MSGSINRIKAVIWKEFRHIFRDKVSCLILFLMPVAVLFILGYAISFEIRSLNVAVCNPTHSEEAELLFSRLDAASKITVTGRIDTPLEIDKAFARDNNRAVLVWADDGIDIFLDGSSTLVADNAYNFIPEDR